MICMLREKWPPHRILIGTESEIPGVLDGPDDHERTFFTSNSDLFRDLPGGPPRPGLKARERGDYEGAFDIRQMAGDEAAASVLRAGFTAEGFHDPEDHAFVFRDDPALRAFMFEQEHWRWQNAKALGQEKRVEDRRAPVSQGLAGRLGRRSG